MAQARGDGGGSPRPQPAGTAEQQPGSSTEKNTRSKKTRLSVSSGFIKKKAPQSQKQQRAFEQWQRQQQRQFELELQVHEVRAEQQARLLKSTKSFAQSLAAIASMTRDGRLSVDSSFLGLAYQTMELMRKCYEFCFSSRGPVPFRTLGLIHLGAADDENSEALADSDEELLHVYKNRVDSIAAQLIDGGYV